ncbi:MAG: ADOP family duplicated permease [Longimicrobiales bacterium]
MRLRRGKRGLGRFFGADPERDVEDEIAFHLEMRTRQRISAGDEPDSARRRALERFGEVEAARLACVEIDKRRRRRMNRADYWSGLKQDVAYAVRSLGKSRGFTAIALITLSLAIGANSAIFSVVNGVLLESLPYWSPDRLVTVETLYANGKTYSVSAPDFASVVEENRVFSGVAAWSGRTMPMTGRGEPREAEIVSVSRDFFDVLGTRTIVGRGFTDDEHVPGAGFVVMLTEGFARRVLGGVREALNQTVTLGGTPFTVVGVLPAGTEMPETADLYLPLPYDSSYSGLTSASRRSEFLTVIGRARDGVTLAMVEQDVRRLGGELKRRFESTNRDVTFTSFALTEKLLGDMRVPLFILLGAVGLVLLVGCANVANLLLARATAREGELAVRVALGAGRGRLVRQLITESIVLASGAAVLGLLLAWWGTRALVAAQPADVPRLASIGIDATVVMYTATLAVATGLLFGTLPALQATGTRVMHALRESGRGVPGGIRGQRIRAALVVSEIALAVVLLVGAGLLVRSFLAMTRVDTGFNVENAVAFRVSPWGPGYGGLEGRERFYARLEERLRALPGVTDVGAAQGLPMTGVASMLGPFSVEGQEVPAGMLPEIRVITVTPGYFAALGTPLLTGRNLDARDGSDAPLAVLINRTAVDRWFPDGVAVGKRIVLGDTPREVVGVVGDVLQRKPGIPIEPEMYLPHAQDRVRTMNVVVRGRMDADALARRVREEVQAFDAQIPIERVDPLSTVFADAVARPRLYTTLLTLFAGVALTLAVVGIFGVMSYMVAQRGREIGVRMALGADAGRVVGMMVGGAMKIAAAGIILGIAGALAVGRVLRSQLFGVGVADPITLLGVLALLCASALLASFLPAWRAARIPPGAALREG